MIMNMHALRIAQWMVCFYCLLSNFVPCSVSCGPDSRATINCCTTSFRIWQKGDTLQLSRGQIRSEWCEFEHLIEQKMHFENILYQLQVHYHLYLSIGPQFTCMNEKKRPNDSAKSCTFNWRKKQQHKNSIRSMYACERNSTCSNVAVAVFHLSVHLWMESK